jgi:hypothetical protein
MPGFIDDIPTDGDEDPMDVDNPALEDEEIEAFCAEPEDKEWEDSEIEDFAPLAKIKVKLATRKEVVAGKRKAKSNVDVEDR